MNTVDFPGSNIVIAKDQPQYHPIPAHYTPDGEVVFCWELTDEELTQVLITKRIWHTVLTFNKPLQPQKLSLEQPQLRS